MDKSSKIEKLDIVRLGAAMIDTDGIAVRAAIENCGIVSAVAHQLASVKIDGAHGKRGSQ